MSLSSYFFFFPPGITLATALAIEPATFATTPFLAPRFFAFDFDFDFAARAFGAFLDLAFAFVCFDIRDSLTPYSFRYL